MESQPQNTEFRNNPETFHPCIKEKQLLLEELNTSLYACKAECRLSC